MRKIYLQNKLDKKLVMLLAALSMVIMLLAVLPAAQAKPDLNADRPTLLLPTEKTTTESRPVALITTAPILLGANYLIHSQSDITEDNAGNGGVGDIDLEDGGWDWNLASGIYQHSAAASPTNIYGETALGLYYAYRATQLNKITPDARYMTAMKDAANFIISTGAANPPRSGSDLIFLMLYDDLPSVCGTTYQAAAKAKYDNRISFYGSALALAQAIGNARAGSGYDNGIIPWDISAWVKVAVMLDARYGGTYAADADAMANYLYDDSFLLTPGYFDVYGADQGYDPTYTNTDYFWYTSGVTGLIDSFDAAQVHTSDIPGLLTTLLACQCPSGGFSYQYGGNTGDEDWQMTALAVITLGSYDPSTYQTQIQSACTWLAGQQDPINGCWDYLAPYGHYPQIGGECIAAMYFAGPVINIDTDEVFWSIQAAIDDLDTVNGNTIQVQPGTYNGNILVYKEVIIQSSAGNATTIIDASQIDVCNYKNAWCKGISYTWAQTYDLGLLKNGFDVWSDNVVIDGFKIVNALWPSQYNRGIGILIGSIHTTYAGFIPWNIDQWGGLISPVDEPTPTGVIIKHNYIDAASDGIYNWASSGNIFEGNTVVNSVAVGGAGIQCYEGGTNNIIRGNFIDNVDGAGVSVCGAWPNVLLDVSNTQVYDNTITYSNVGIQFYNIAGTGVSAYNNQILNNNIGIFMDTGGATVATAYCNDIVGNTVGAQNTASDGIFNAECNWWGDCSGPSGQGLGSGDPVGINIDFTPWVGYVVADAGGPYTSSSGIVTFDGSGSQASDCCGSTVSYTWNFGDGNLGSGMNPTHTYTTYGTFTATLTVTVVTPYGTCQDTDQTTVTIPYKVVVDKKIQNGTTWVDNIRVNNGTTVNFRITITNLGSLPLNQVTITDYLSLPQLKYLYNAVPTPTSASDNQVIWTLTIPAGQTTTITYSAKTIHVCYGWNSVYLKNSQGTILGYDLTKVKVVNPGQPTLAISTQAWDEGQNTWTDHIGLTLNKDIQFKITISSTALTTLHDVTITDILPTLIAYNNDATLTPTSTSPNEITWAIGEVAPGDEIEITFTASTLKMGTEYTTANVASSEGYADEDYVLLETDSAPNIMLLYPVGGETLKGSINILWNANDVKDGSHLPISLYIKQADGTLSAFSGNPYLNTGELNWDTTSLPDGRYQLQIATQDSNNNVVNVMSTQFQIKNTETPTENLAPVTPGAPQGSAEGKPGLEYTYSASTTDPEGDQVYYLWDWGDGTNSGWLGPYNSGDAIETIHTWAVKGSYSIKVMAKDSFGLESSWSDPLPITMPYTYQPLLQFLENLFERFPNLFPVLRQLFGY